MAETFGQLGAVVVFTEDLARSKAFYGESLGLTAAGGDDHSAVFLLERASPEGGKSRDGGGGMPLIILESGAAHAQLANEPTAVPSRAGASAFYCSFTDDVDSLHRELASRGVHFFQDPTDQPWGMRTAYFRDPDGHVWELTQPLD